MRLLFLLVIAAHGLIHLMGFTKAFGYAEMSQLKLPISPAVGVFWLLSALAFLAAAVLLATRHPAWCWVALAAVAVSQTLIFLAWTDARFGTVANLIVLAPALAAALESQPGSYRHRYEAAIRQRLKAASEDAPLTEADMAHLPVLVRKYLRRVGAAGKPRVSSFRIVFDGEFRNGLHGASMPFRSEQVNSVEPPSRAFLMKARMHGVPAEGLHLFQEGRATMQIKLAALVTVVDAGGPKMDQSETVTLFNDLCLFAPSALIDRERIQWEEDGPLSVRADFRHGEHTVGARLVFNADGDLVDFLSNDRYLSSDGRNYQSYPWSTPVHAWAVVDGRRVPSRAAAVWHTPEGEFVYGRFNVVEVNYNIEGRVGVSKPGPARTSMAPARAT